MKTALIAGATGLIGKQLLQLLLQHPSYTHVKALSRKPLGITHQKLENILMNFDSMHEHTVQLQADDVFCCLGTTMKQAGSKAAFKKVDYDYPLELAEISKAQGARQYLLITALGADKRSSIFYNQVKGEIEEAIDKAGFETYHIFRPSFLGGHRSEKRPGEDAIKIIYSLLGFLIPKKYKVIDSAKVARAMVHFASQEVKGKYIHESFELQSF